MSLAGPFDPRSFADDRGAAMVMALLATVLLNAIGLGLIALTNTEVVIASNYREAAETLHAAEAAAECAVGEVMRATSWNDVLAGLSVSTFRDGNLAPGLASGETLNVVALTASVQAASDARSQRGANNPRWQLFLNRALSQIVRSTESRAHVVAWVADDATETDNDPLADSNNIVTVRAQAVGRLGMQRSIEAVLAKRSVGVTVLSWREVR